MRVRRLLLVVAVLWLVVPREGYSQTDQFAGTWVSANDPVLNVTTLESTGTFKTQQLKGLTVIGTIAGRWRVRDNAFVWTYTNPPSSEDDVNPIVSSSRDRFTLREADGSQSTFFRQGVVDPGSPALLPVAVGTGWVFEDEAGEMAIRVSVRQMFGGKDCYRVDWIAGGAAYQSEFWTLGDDGVSVVGRRVAGKDLVFARPYLLLKRTPVAGDRWESSVSAPGLTSSFTITVGAEEGVVTPAGTFRAVRVTLEGNVLSYRRWYARGVGLVREEPTLSPDGGQRVNQKNLKRRIE